MEEQTTQKDWLKSEAENLTKPTDFEELPSLKLQPNIIVELEVDFSKPFGEWEANEEDGKITIKKILPVTVSGTRMNWWLNTKNPVYSEIVKLGVTGQTKFKVLQTGTQKNTRYNLVK